MQNPCGSRICRLVFIPLLLSAFFFLPEAEAKLSWSYKAFPVVEKNYPLRKREPALIKVGKIQMLPLMNRQSGTHRKWNVEQIYLSKDQKQKLFIKYKVKVSTKQAIGGWSRLKHGYVLHLQVGKDTVAYMAQGFNTLELYELQKQLKSKMVAEGPSWQERLWANVVMPCAHADELGDAMGNIYYNTEQNTPSTEPVEEYLIVRAANVLTCVGGETINGSIEKGKALWENATWENIKGAAANAPAAAWEGTKAVGRGIRDGFNASVDFIHEQWTDGESAWEDISESWNRTTEVVAQTWKKVSEAYTGWNELKPEVQDRIVCDTVSNLASTGVLGLALAATGAGATAAMIKLGAAVIKYVNRIKPLMGAIEAISKANLPEDEMLEQIDKILKGEMSEDELKALNAGERAAPAAARSLAARTEELRGLSNSERNLMLKAAGELDDASRLRVASQELGRPLSTDQQAALLRAHEVGGNRGFGNYTQADLRQKRQILLDAGFSSDEADYLMRRGLAGRYYTGSPFPKRDLTELPTDRTPTPEDYRIRAEALANQKSPEALGAHREAVRRYREAVAREERSGLDRMEQPVRMTNAEDTAANLLRMETEPERIAAAKDNYVYFAERALEREFRDANITYLPEQRGQIELYLRQLRNQGSKGARQVEALVEHFNAKYKGYNGWVPLTVSGR